MTKLEKLQRRFINKYCDQYDNEDPINNYYVRFCRRLYPIQFLIAKVNLSDLTEDEINDIEESEKELDGNLKNLTLNDTYTIYYDYIEFANA